MVAVGLLAAETGLATGPIGGRVAEGGLVGAAVFAATAMADGSCALRLEPEPAADGVTPALPAESSTTRTCITALPGMVPAVEEEPEEATGLLAVVGDTGLPERGSWAPAGWTLALEAPELGIGCATGNPERAEDWGAVSPAFETPAGETSGWGGAG